MSSPPLDTALPSGWYCRSVSVSGYGVYEKHKRTTRSIAGRQCYVWNIYRVMFIGWMGGWVADTREGSYFFGGQAFPTYLGAIIALEIELANQQ